MTVTHSETYIEEMQRAMLAIVSTQPGAPSVGDLMNYALAVATRDVRSDGELVVRAYETVLYKPSMKKMIAGRAYVPAWSVRVGRHVFVAADVLVFVEPEEASRGL